MTDGDPRPPAPRNQLREEAAQWFVRMRGADAEQHRGAFERWLAMGALHRRAYDSIAETWDVGAGLCSADMDSAKPRPSPGPALLSLAVAASLLLVGLGIGWRWNLSQPSATIPEAIATFQSGNLATQSSARSYRLPDGSAIRLEPATALTFAVGPSERNVTVKRGRVRFAVAHDQRQFVVRAGGGTVIDRGTVFDVSVGRSSVLVHLVTGSIEVRSAAGKPDTGEARILRPSPGETVTYRAVDPRSRASAIDERGALLDLDDVSLTDVLAAADRFPGTPVVLADRSLGSIRVSGTIRVDDHARLARHLSYLLGLDAVQTDGAISLRPAQQISSAAR